MQVKDVSTWCTGSRGWLQEDDCDRFVLLAIDMCLDVGMSFV